MYDFTKLFKLPVSKKNTPKEVIQQIVVKVKEVANLDINPDHCRLRKRFMNKLANLYRNSLSTLNEKHHLVLEVCEKEPEEIPFNSLLVYVRFWQAD